MYVALAAKALVRAERSNLKSYILHFVFPAKVFFMHQSTGCQDTCTGYAVTLPTFLASRKVPSIYLHTCYCLCLPRLKCQHLLLVTLCFKLNDILETSLFFIYVQYTAVAINSVPEDLPDLKMSAPTIIMPL